MSKVFLPTFYDDAKNVYDIFQDGEISLVKIPMTIFGNIIHSNFLGLIFLCSMIQICF